MMIPDNNPGGELPRPQAQCIRASHTMLQCRLTSIAISSSPRSVICVKGNPEVSRERGEIYCRCCHIGIQGWGEQTGALIRASEA